MVRRGGSGAGTYVALLGAEVFESETYVSTMFDMQKTHTCSAQVFCIFHMLFRRNRAYIQNTSVH
jgi:hypothetical protein